MVVKLDLMGQRFNRLVVISALPATKSGTRWLCQCDCGRKRPIYTNNLKKGFSKSCGCLRKEARKRTGHLIEHKGRSLTIRQWSAETGIKRETIAQRLYAGWEVERALSQPVRLLRPTGHLFE